MRIGELRDRDGAAGGLTSNHADRQRRMEEIRPPGEHPDREDAPDEKGPDDRVRSLDHRQKRGRMSKSRAARSIFLLAPRA